MYHFFPFKAIGAQQVEKTEVFFSQEKRSL